MEINFEDFLLNIKDQYLEDNIILTKESRFREMNGWDSMTGMTILLMIEETYKIKIESDIFKNLNTIDDLYTYIISYNN